MSKFKKEISRDRDVRDTNICKCVVYESAKRKRNQSINRSIDRLADPIKRRTVLLISLLCFVFRKAEHLKHLK